MSGDLEVGCCPVCEQPVAVTYRGTVRRHFARTGGICRGGHRYPRTTPAAVVVSGTESEER